MNELMSVSLAAKRWSLSDETVRGWIHDGLLPAARLPDGQFQVESGDIDEVVHSSRAYEQRHNDRLEEIGASLDQAALGQWLADAARRFAVSTLWATYLDDCANRGLDPIGERTVTPERRREGRLARAEWLAAMRRLDDPSRGSR